MSFVLLLQKQNMSSETKPNMGRVPTARNLVQLVCIGK